MYFTDRGIEELQAASAEFRAVWAEHDVRLPAAGLHRFHHPLDGDLELVFEAAAPGRGRTAIDC